MPTPLRYAVAARCYSATLPERAQAGLGACQPSKKVTAYLGLAPCAVALVNKELGLHDITCWRCVRPQELRAHGSWA
ncbi:hypothetical protein NDU88_001284 [Pleurodeles waltl]|uniref:Uncharacterized protein n=1 Tax=Pleurodeles waltl TaxID=8319 RepID=A0AAV7SZP6_PLEWA|nr:hypothetical protein NDU88_001284 [Pleurodeles waltl]